MSEVSKVEEKTPPPESPLNPPGSTQDIPLPESLPLIGLDSFVLFPFMIAPMMIGQLNTKKMVDDVLRGERLVGVFLKKKPEESESFGNLYSVGTLAVILKMLRMPDGSVRLLLHGVERIRIVRELQTDPYLTAKAEKVEETNADTRPVQAMVRSVQQQIQEIVQLGQMPEDMGAAVLEMHDPGKLADLAISHAQVKMEERQEMLETGDVEKRLGRVMEILGRELDLLRLGSEIQTKVASKMDKRQREYMLREQMKTIRKELGEDEDQNLEIQELAEEIRKADMPEHALKVAEKELNRLERMHPSSPEYSVSRTYLDWLISLPWKKSTQDNINIDKAKRILDEDHYGLTDIKERILEYLSVIKLKRQIRGPILCFVGPPGVGKTSLGRSIARALGRNFCRMSLGGMRDEAEIRGHRRTYIGSLPGRIIKSIKDCGSNNPLIMLDEVDKIGSDFRGDPASALLEVLDPEQNFSFTDHYLDMPFDLSKVMFITTANLLDPIPSPLRDRMEILRLSGYTTREKVEIARRYLIPRSYENTGVSKNHVRFSDEGLLRVIEGYTRESGVRNLEREIGNICRKVARGLAAGRGRSVTVGPREVENFLGPKRFDLEVADRTSHPGVATGLAWTQTGGEILFIEACAVPGSGQLLLTGQLGEVMKESAMAALNFLHSNAGSLGIPEEQFSKQNFHLHVPAGATPKDGPSAGITMAAAFCSLLTGVPIKPYLAMTGEITLKGKVLQVGGIKEKILAAHRASIKELILPRRCEPELKKDVPEEVRRSIHFHFVDHVLEVLQIAFPEREIRGEEAVRTMSSIRIEPERQIAQPAAGGQPPAHGGEHPSSRNEGPRDSRGGRPRGARGGRPPASSVVVQPPPSAGGAPAQTKTPVQAGAPAQIKTPVQAGAPAPSSRRVEIRKEAPIPVKTASEIRRPVLRIEPEKPKKVVRRAKPEPKASLPKPAESKTPEPSPAKAEPETKEPPVSSAAEGKPRETPAGHEPGGKSSSRWRRLRTRTPRAESSKPGAAGLPAQAEDAAGKKPADSRKEEHKKEPHKKEEHGKEDHGKEEPKPGAATGAAPARKRPPRRYIKVNRGGSGK
jgi:ATP-dependent Lon protease